MIDQQTIEILGVPYRLKHVDTISREELRIGEIDFLRQEILLLNGLEKEIERVTLWHEVIHGIFSQLGFEDEAVNEHLIQSLANALYQVLKENTFLRSV
mgnify:CR=1 FL=1